MSKIEDDFSKYISEHRDSLFLSRDEYGILVAGYKASSDHGLISLPVLLHEGQWRDFYDSVREIDDHPFSMMAIYLDEAVAYAINMDLKAPYIKYDGHGFTTEGYEYTPPQT